MALEQKKVAEAPNPKQNPETKSSEHGHQNTKGNRFAGIAYQFFSQDLL
jgi:hypothetical protein